MDIRGITRLEEQGVVMELRPSTPFSIQDPEKVWLVLEGKLDLFLVELHNGEPAGARHHVMRVEAGHPVMGFVPPCDLPLGLIANPAPGSKVLCLQQGQLRQAASTSPSTVMPLLDQWVESLSSAASDRSAPKYFRKLEPQGEVLIEERPQAVLPLSGLVWVRHRGGSSSLLGDEEMPPLEQRSIFPVTRAAWLRCAAQTHLECFDSLHVPQLDPQWSGLREFQAQVFAYLALQHRRQAEKEKARLQLVAEADARVFESALFKLAAPLRGEDGKLLQADTGHLDPLLQACQVVGNATGVQIHPVPHALEGIKKRDPVAAIAQASRIRIRQVILKGQWWNDESGPMVGFFDEDKRPVALLPGSPRGYRVYDPQTRAEVGVDEELSRKLHGLAYVFYRPFPSKALGVRDIFAFGLRGCRRELVTILLMGVGIGLLAMVTPVLTGIIFDSVIPGAQRSTLADFSLFLVISAVATALFSVTRSLATLRLEGKMDASVQAAVWDRLLALPVPFFRKFTAGDLARRSLGISQIRETLTGSVLSSILSGVFSISSFALLFYYSWRLAVIAAGLVVFSFLAITLCGYLQVRYLRDASQVGGRIAGMTLQFINGIPKFRVAGTEGRAFAAWAQEFAKQKVMSIKARKVSNAVSVFNSTFPVLTWGVIFYFTAALMNTPDTKALTTGEFLAFMAAFVQFSYAAADLSSALISVLNVVPLYERAKPILTSLPEVDAAKTDPGEITGQIDVHHMSFRYRADGPLVLRDISISIPSGQFVAFVGPSGSGKSTLFRLLLGFEKPEAGAIYYDGQDLGELDFQAVRRQIGVVLQNARLMTGDIFRNIVGGGALTIDDAWEAARLAGFDEDIKAMPMGMHTMVSEGGGGLSGGQRQRLMIARAIVHKPRVLLFDEATSALDNRTQAIVSRSLKSLNATRVVIAHRLTTVMHADRIYVLDKGSLVEEGTYDELMAQGGLFSLLSKRQLS
jgi:NHLM bacteriocin system ABC transporter ATP-binding protein